ncbi:choline dehydrogenase, partial [Candidatus Bathyarchaeota archaeon]|nr:choline dehydrogenase [Candidatus Bathyarchaeota archaeon]
ELGGVVGADLLVHGVTGLSVADSSVMPIIPVCCFSRGGCAERELTGVGDAHLLHGVCHC